MRKTLLVIAALVAFVLSGCVDVDASQRRADDTNAQIALDAYRAGQQDARSQAATDGAIDGVLIAGIVMITVYIFIAGVAINAFARNRAHVAADESLPRVVSIYDPNVTQIGTVEHQNILLKDQVNQLQHALWLTTQVVNRTQQIEAPRRR